jgi:hypothetical protein
MDYAMREKSFPSWILGGSKNQGDEMNHQEVINDDSVYMIYELWMLYLNKYLQQWLSFDTSHVLWKQDFLLE